jgi:hypothetical protein
MIPIYHVESFSQLNIHMKNNKGYYHWIHSLNSVVSGNQIRAQKILTEQNIGKTTAQSIANAGGDAGVYIHLKKLKDAERAAMQQRNLGPIDSKPMGSAQSVEDDAQDGFLEDPELTKLPSYPIAAQARAETEELLSQEEENWEEKEEARRLSDYTGREGERMYESVNNRIRRIINF